MLAEFGEQKRFLAQLPELRRTFERFVSGGRRTERRNKTYVWDRSEVLDSNGISFTLNVGTEAPYKTIREADLVITISGPDGSDVEEILPSFETLLKTHAAGDYVELPERLAELKTVVDDFLGPRQPSFHSSG